MKNRLILFILIIAVQGCKSFVDTPLPANNIVSGVAFNNDASAVSVLLSAYGSVQNTSGSISNADLFADEIYWPGASSLIEQEQENTYTDVTNYSFFDNYYKAIFIANTILEALKQPNPLTPSVAKQLEGESKFLRAYSHFQLVRLHGSPPLITTTDVSVSAYIGNTPQIETYAAILNDLKDAYELVGTDYPSEDRARANKAVVSALLARVDLYTKNWAAAEVDATREISDPAYNLPADLNTVFLKDSPEIIWQLWSQNAYTSAGATYVPDNTDQVSYILRPGLLEAFEADDKRKDSWTKEATGVNTGLYFAYKYKNNTSNNGATEYYVELRLGEQYLIRAEARAQQNKIADGLADLNVIRARAGLADAVADTKETLLLLIEKERRIELMTEAGSRWFDLNRTGRTTYWLQPIKPTWLERDTVLPYPAAIILANPNLKQNPGY